MGRMRHTMGNDWGGRPKLNPENCPKVTKRDVLDYAAEYGFKVRRGWVSQIDGGFNHDDSSSWYMLESDGLWHGIGGTNYLALERMKEM